MNKTKHPISAKLKKKIAKEIRSSQELYPTQEAEQYSDEQTSKELLKKYPNRKRAKQEEALSSVKKGILLKKKLKAKITSKRTTPGSAVSSDSPPASIHPEGKRWMKTLVKQNLAQRAILAHKGNRIGRKK